MSTESRHKGRRKSLLVVDRDGKRQRFLRGIMTHDLIQRGLEFDDAYAVARAVRDHLGGRDEVDTAELFDLIQRQVERQLGITLPPRFGPAPQTPQRYVVDHGQRQPFSRGLLARSMQAAGLELDRAYTLVGALEEELQDTGPLELPKDDLARRVGALLERLESRDAAQRYRLMRRIHRLPKPLVLYLGGASGTGKSTLALELAPLLRIYRINATDTIRQMMRMVFSPQILPSLHSSSFEWAPSFADGVGDTVTAKEELDDEQRLLLAFEEQATRVCVGVRAGVERAIAENMNLLVEGVHLYPPLVPFGDLEGVIYQIPLVLATPDEEVHRGRFLNRARNGRLAERYLEQLSAIRRVHDFVLQQAEAHEVPLLDTSDEQAATTQQILRLITGILRKQVSRPGHDAGADITVPTLLLFIDGLADRPARALGGRTPLQAAELPHLDRLATEGRCGLADPVAPGVVPDTAAGSLALMGQSPLALKRGPVEALGAGLDLRLGDIALRGNFATLGDDHRIVDRRAGRIREGTEALAKALDRMSLPGESNVQIRVAEGTEHRLAIVLRGDGLSSEIQGSDPGDGAPAGPPLIPRPNDPKSSPAAETARLLALFEQKAREILAAHPINRAREAMGLPVANAILTRGAGRIHQLSALEQHGIPLSLRCIGGDRTVLGLARWLGAKIRSNDAMTANLDTDVGAKFEAALEGLEHDDLTIVHLKGADIAAHDQRPDLKVEFLERVDRALGDLLSQRTEPFRVTVASDHATLSEGGQHAADPLPVLIWGEGIEADSVCAYDEVSASGGAMERFPLQLLLGRLFDLG